MRILGFITAEKNHKVLILKMMCLMVLLKVYKQKAKDEYELKIVLSV